MVSSFIGVDLSWKCEPYKIESTVVCSCDPKGNLSMPERTTSDDDILNKMSYHNDPWVAMDASLKVPNETDLRAPEGMLMKEGIRVLPTNQDFLNRHCGSSRGEILAEMLWGAGFKHGDPSEKGNRLFFETYPYTILRSLTNEMIVYKIGMGSVRREGRLNVIGTLERWLPDMNMPSELSDLLRGER